MNFKNNLIMKTLNFIFIAILSLAFFACEENNENYNSFNSAIINPELNLIESDSTYSVNDLLHSNSELDINTFNKIIIYLVDNNSNERFYLSHLFDADEQILNYSFNIENNDLLEKKIFPTSIYIEILNNNDITILSGLISFKYQGDYLNDFIDYYYNDYPVNVNFPVSEIIVDEVYNLNDYKDSLNFNKPVSFIVINLYDSDMNKLNSDIEYFNDSYQFPFMQFGINYKTYEEFNPAFYELLFVHSIDRFQEFILLSKVTLPVSE